MVRTFRNWFLPGMLLLAVLGLTTEFVAAQDNDADGTANTTEADEDGGEGGEAAEGVEEGEAEDGEGSTPVAPVTLEDVQFIANNLWIMIAGMLVFIMHLGFATLESGLTRSKNTVNILFKNSMIICIGLLTYGIMGFNLMYPGFDTEPAHDEKSDTYTYADSGFLKFAGFGFLANGRLIADGEAAAEADKEAQGGKNVDAYTANSTKEYNVGFTYYTDFFFQAMFAATCATIVSGAVAGRIKLSTFLVFSALFVTFCYPVTGSWKWGLGFLERKGFYDFAGSTLVHSVGGWGALVMAVLLGPRKGKYVDGRVQAIPPSNLPLAAIGVFLLWFGWFGFNGGSVLSADPGLVSLTLVTTSLAAAAGGFTAAMVSWVCGKKPDLSMALNGMLAGLVGITAGADQMSGIDAIAIGVIAGVLVYFAVIFIDGKLKIDDPVGAISVHLVCGIWGTLAVGIFGASAGMDQFVSQLIGVGAVGGFTLIFCLIVGMALKATMGLRVDEEEEQKGLDIGEHGMEAYSLVSS